MMRDILLKTMFRMNLDLVSEISRAICLPVPLTQELVDWRAASVWSRRRARCTPPAATRWAIS
jgi:hypothetical protein